MTRKSVVYDSVVAATNQAIREVKEQAMTPEQNHDSKKGLYRKFQVERTDGRSAEGEKHHDCQYYVLDLDHDPFAKFALVAYANACRIQFPQLAEDLNEIARKAHKKGWLDPPEDFTKPPGFAVVEEWGQFGTRCGGCGSWMTADRRGELKCSLGAGAGCGQ